MNKLVSEFPYSAKLKSIEVELDVLDYLSILQATLPSVAAKYPRNSQLFSDMKLHLESLIYAVFSYKSYKNAMVIKHPTRFPENVPYSWTFTLQVKLDSPMYVYQFLNKDFPTEFTSSTLEALEKIMFGTPLYSPYKHFNKVYAVTYPSDIQYFGEISRSTLVKHSDMVIPRTWKEDKHKSSEDKVAYKIGEVAKKGDEVRRYKFSIVLNLINLISIVRACEEQLKQE